MSYNDKIKRWIERELEKLSSSLPTERITLEEAVAGRLEVKAKDGSRIAFNKEDVEELKKHVPKALWKRFTLPIVIVKNPEYGPGHFEVYGSELERRVVAEILGILEYKRGDRLIIRSDQVERLLKKFKSIISIGLIFRV